MTGMQPLPAAEEKGPASKSDRKRRFKVVDIVLWCLGTIIILGLLALWFVIVVYGQGYNAAYDANHSYRDAVVKLQDCTKQVSAELQLSPADIQAQRTVAEAVTGKYGTGLSFDFRRFQADIPRVAGDSGQIRALLAFGSCQDSFLEAQAHLSDALAEVDNYRKDPLLGWDFAIGDLKVELPGKDLHGQAALDYMKRPLTDTALQPS